jgi:malonate-semialdehyde dehydrogenase (acetylating)/methylmalonate-semialdehyde dehydrogenase
MDPNTDVGPVISIDALARIENLIQFGITDGAQAVLDGRGVHVQDYDHGTFVGPTILHCKDPKKALQNRAYVEEIFGPVLFCVNVPTLDDAIQFVNSNKYGNGCAIFTQSGTVARKFQWEVDVGQVGVNVPIPVPLPFFSFTGTKPTTYLYIHTHCT